MTDKSDTKKRIMLQALEESLGIVSVASKKANIHRSTHYEWYKNDGKYKETVDEIKNVCIDFVESKLFENIKDKKETSILFYLKTQAKHRGYVERQELEIADTHFKIEILNPNEKDTD